MTWLVARAMVRKVRKVRRAFERPWSPEAIGAVCGMVVTVIIWTAVAVIFR